MDRAQIEEAGDLRVCGQVPCRAFRNEDISICLVRSALLGIRSDGDRTGPDGLVFDIEIDIRDGIEENIAIQDLLRQDDFRVTAVRTRIAPAVATVIACDGEDRRRFILRERAVLQRDAAVGAGHIEHAALMRDEACMIRLELLRPCDTDRIGIRVHDDIVRKRARLIAFERRSIERDGADILMTAALVFSALTVPPVTVTSPWV